MRFNANVPEDGITYFLGDMGLCKGAILEGIIKGLNGTKILILGNHDKGINAMHNVGFDAVLHGMVLWIAGERVTLSHCPLLGLPREDTGKMRGSTGKENWHGEGHASYEKFTFSNEGQFHLHGHIHSRPERKESEQICKRQFDIGVPANGYYPVSFARIESWIKRTKRKEENGL